MAREKLGAFLSDYPEVVQVSDKISYTSNDRDLDGIRVPGVDDLGRDPLSGKQLIGHNDAGSPSAAENESLINDFLNYLTKDATNYYRVKGGAKPAQPLARVLPDGGARAAQPIEEGQDKFVSNQDPTMTQYSNSGYFENTVDQSTLTGKIVTKYNNLLPDQDGALDAATGTRGPFTGNKLLPSVEGNEPNSGDATFTAASSNDSELNTINEVQTMLGVRNRFNTEAEKAYAPYDSADLSSAIDSGTDDIGTTTAQSKFGVYDKNAPIMKSEDLKNVARSMMLKSIGLDLATDPGTSQDPNEYPYDKATVASVASNDIGINATTLKSPRAREAFGGPTNPGLNSSPFDGGSFEMEDKESYGNSYDSFLQFDNFSNSAVKLRAATVIVAMLFAVKEVKDNLVFSSYTSNSINLNRARGVPGQAIRFAADAKTQMFNRYVISQTRFPLDDCLNAGTKLLFGINFDDVEEAPGPAAEVKKYQTVSESSGFWYSVGRTILQRFQERSQAIEDATEKFESDPDAVGVSIFGLLSRTGIVGIIDTIAQIGDKALYSTGGSDLPGPGDGPRAFNVDNLADSGQTRQSKSRSQSGLTENSLAWRGSTAPSLYLLPRNVVKAVIDMNTQAYGGNPLKAHVATPIIEKSFIDINGFASEDAGGKTTRGRIPTDVRRMIENDLDAEYVPFYFHDVRTNEVVGFHAFLNNLTDSYQPNFTATAGYGRVDPVYTYKDTKRSLSFSFYVAATSKEDFDEMWFKINKLTTMVYPSWTPGTRMYDVKGNLITQPFSQKIGATPLIRLRIGDVVKSNYSRFNLARIFGVGTDTGFKIADKTYMGKQASTLLPGLISNIDNLPFRQPLADIQLNVVFNALFGSPLSFVMDGSAGASIGDRLVRTLVSTGARALGGSGIVNPLGAHQIVSEFINPDSGIEPNVAMGSANNWQDSIDELARSLRGNLTSVGMDDKPGYRITKNLKGSSPILKASNDVGYKLVDTSDPDSPVITRIRTIAPYRVKVKAKNWVNVDSVKLGEKSSGTYESGDADRNLSRKKLLYNVELFDIDAPNIGSHTLQVWHEDLMPNPDAIFMKRVSPFLDALGFATSAIQAALFQEVAPLTGVPADLLNLTTTNAREFMHPVNNSITRAFEESGGRGLAGVIQSLSYDWVDGSTVWEVDWGSRAPKVAKINVSFDVIHDIPPGLDEGGYNRGPAYNVGSINNASMDDPDPDSGVASRSIYKRAALAGTQRLKKK